MKTFEWDIAISLCKQDIEFAKTLVAAINPGLKVFFYENKQEQIIAKSGPEVFAKFFKDARVVVILSRDEWSKTFYTEIERNSIVDRLKNDGYRFIFMIPMEQGQKPHWYPETQIYIDPLRFTPEQIAQFIEYTVTQEGGIVKPVTLEDMYAQLHEKVAERRKLVLFQETPVAIEAGKEEVTKLKEIFNKKIDVLTQPQLFGLTHNLFYEQVSEGKCGLDDFILECKVNEPDKFGHRVVTSQQYQIVLRLLQFSRGGEAKIVEQIQLVFFYSPVLKGWAKQIFYDRSTVYDLSVLFRNAGNRDFYELENPVSSEILIDSWFQKLLKLSSVHLEKYL